MTQLFNSILLRCLQKIRLSYLTLFKASVNKRQFVDDENAAIDVLDSTVRKGSGDGVVVTKKWRNLYTACLQHMPKSSSLAVSPKKVQRLTAKEARNVVVTMFCSS